MLASDRRAWKDLEEHVREAVEGTHLRELLKDEPRAEALCAEFDGIFLDYSRQRVTERTMDLLFDLADETGVMDRVAAMRAGDRINSTEARAVMHVALRAAEGDSYTVDGVDVVPEVHAVLDQVRAFAEETRSAGTLRDVVVIGIGGSYLGAEFVAEALRHEPVAREAAAGRRLRFLANVDPVDVARALDGLEPATTLAVVVSKTFTTTETITNATTVRDWFRASLGEAGTAGHIVAVTSAVDKAAAFGIDRTFAMWDWVGGRYSVSSAVGVLPLALHFGFPVVRRFLDGARAVDRHFFNAPPRANLPVILGLLGVYNASFLGMPAHCLAPYSQALLRFAAHIQQVSMESNGKGVDLQGRRLPFATGALIFGEPGTNSQHSFFQLLHQGRPAPVDFIGFVRSQNPVEGQSAAGGASNHDHLMSNFLAQPDALAAGKTADEIRADGVAADVVPHKVMTGNRPSSVLLLDRLDAYSAGQLLALYEHRTAVEGFVWGINSFDQWGVELGKALAKRVLAQFNARRADPAAPVQGFNPSTARLLARYTSSRL